MDGRKTYRITLPDIDGRDQSMHVVNQDHFMFAQATKPGTYPLTEDEVGTRFAMVTFRTFADVTDTDTDDIAKAHAAQDAIKMSGAGKGPLGTPDWDLAALAVARKALSDIAVLGFSADYALGSKEETRPIDHLVGAAAGWGGLPRTAAPYVVDSVSANDGKTLHAVTVKDVPVNAFWSTTFTTPMGILSPTVWLCTATKTFQPRQTKMAALRSISGGCDDGRGNCIPITEGLNHAIRLYDTRRGHSGRQLDFSGLRSRQLTART